MQILSAATTHPNTPETDRQARVTHTVRWLDDDQEEHETQVMAACPLDAMEQVRMAVARNA